MNSNRKLTRVFSRTHFDRDQRPKTLQISFNAPEPPDSYGNIKEGNIILSILSKDNSIGFSVSTGDTADLIDTLTAIRKSLISESIRMMKEVGK